MTSFPFQCYVYLPCHKVIILTTPTVKCIGKPIYFSVYLRGNRKDTSYGDMPFSSEIKAPRASSQYKDRLSQVWNSHVKDKTVSSLRWHLYIAPRVCSKPGGQERVLLRLDPFFHASVGQFLGPSEVFGIPYSLGATARSYRRQDGADAAARFEKFLPARASLWPTISSQIYNRETRRHGTPYTKTTDSYHFSFLYNNPRNIRRETTVGKYVRNNGRR